MDLADLYRDVIIDHNRNPRNFRRIEPPCEQAEGHNPLCGDKLHVYLKLDGDRIEDAAFEGSGCAISVASASLMTEAVIGTTADEARNRIRRMYAVLKGEAEADPGVRSARADWERALLERALVPFLLAHVDLQRADRGPAEGEPVGFERVVGAEERAQ